MATHQTAERRNDIGFKTTISALLTVIALSMGMFINNAWSIANEGRLMATTNKIEIVELKAILNTKVTRMASDIEEIKGILKGNNFAR